MAIKKRSYSWFSKECMNCLNKNICISAGAFHQGLRQYFLHLKGFEYPANEAMLKGKLLHETAQRNLQDLDEYGIDNFLKDLPSGKVITLKELPVCSSLYALKGVIDKIKFTYYPSTNRLSVYLTEFKSSFNRKYILQVVAYGLILSDFYCRIGHGQRGKRKMTRLYPDDKILINITFELSIFGGGGYKQEFMKDNHLTEWAHGISAAILKKKQSYKNFHQAGLYFLHEIPMCEKCYKEKCPYWEICKKFEYKSHKTKQRYFGKKRLLIKSKPKII